MISKGVAILCIVLQGLVPWGICLCAAAEATAFAYGREAAQRLLAQEPVPSGCCACTTKESEENSVPACPCISKRAADQPYIVVRQQRLLPDNTALWCALVETGGLETTSTGSADLLDAPWSWPWSTHSTRQAMLAVWLK